MSYIIEPINIQAAWKSKDLSTSFNWLYEFTKEDINTMKNALYKIKKYKVGMREINKEKFQLKALGEKLEKFALEIKYGQGFKIFRGFPVLDYSIEEASLIFWGICQYIGVPVPQTAGGDIIYYVKDLGKDEAKRYSETNHRLPFHTDGSDIISLLCYKTAATGGLSKFVSSVSIYNKMLLSNPEYVQLLTKPLHSNFTMDSTICKNFAEYERILPFAFPIFNIINGLPVNRYAAGYITSAINRKIVSPITEEQKKALTELNRLANDNTLYYGLKLEDGDMEFFNNNYIFHARTEYEDDENKEKARCIIRIWLDSPELETIPPLFGYN